MFTLAVPTGSLDFWKTRLSDFGPEWFVNGLGEKSLMVDDPDGLRFHIAERPFTNAYAYTEVIPPEYAIQAVAGVTICARSDATKRFIEEKFSLLPSHTCKMESGQTKFRYTMGLQELDVIPLPTRSLAGRGTIHHVAFRTQSSFDQQNWLKWLVDHGSHPSEIKDRQYFRSIYFREPSGALCEIATDDPGFLVDESKEQLGTALQLPSFMSRFRDDIVAGLPPITLPSSTQQFV